MNPKNQKIVKGSSNLSSGYGPLAMYLHSQGGYVAFISVLVFATVMLTIGISVTLLAISETQMSLAGKKSEETVDFVESCVEEALLRLRREGTIPIHQVLLPAGICDVNIDSRVDDDWTFTVSGEQEGYYKSIRVRAIRNSEILVVSWKEI